VSLASKLKIDIGRRRRLIAESERLIKYWEHELAHPPSQVDHSIPLPRAGVDYAYGTPNYRELRALGYTFICRYLGGPESKVITATEAKAAANAGLELVTVFEQDPQRALGDYGAGELDAHVAARQLEQAGAPPHAVAYFAVDFDMQADQFLRVLGYIQGAQHVLGFGRVGVYGGYRTVHELLVGNHVRYGWQTYAWSAGQWTNAQLRQVQNNEMVPGVNCDVDKAEAADFGQWKPV
jgi:hypothetical protein